jgi:FkbM family methyltransferase
MKDRPHEFDHVFARLDQLRGLRLNPQMICDVGASDGEWTRQCIGIFPDSQYLCVEPLGQYQGSLGALADRYRNVRVFCGCLGARSGQTQIHSAGFSSSLLPDNAGNSFGWLEPVEVERLDVLVERGLCTVPDLLKIDVQGYEIEVLRGLGSLMRSVTAIIVELSFYRFYKDMPVFHEVVAFLAGHGFVVADVLSLMTRPLDGMAGQSDVLFIQQSHVLQFDMHWDYPCVDSRSA